MYRIKTVSGEESVFKTLEEFNAAVRSGVISPESEIFHSRAERWLEVKSHPHYRAALSWKPETSNGSAHPTSHPVSRTNVAKPSNTPDLAGAAPAVTSSVARPAPHPRTAAKRPDGGAPLDVKEQLAALSGKHSVTPSAQQPPMPGDHSAEKGHQPSAPDGQHHSTAAAAQSSPAAPPKPQAPAPGLRTVVAPPKQASKPAAIVPAQSPPAAAPKPRKSAEILFIDLEDGPPAAAPSPTLSSSTEQPAVSAVAPSPRAATGPGTNESKPADPVASSNQPRVNADQSSPRAEARPSGEKPKPRAPGFIRPEPPATVARASEPPAPKSAGPVGPTPETELDFLVMGPSLEPIGRKPNGERVIEQEAKARSGSPAMGHSGSGSPLIPPIPSVSSLLHGSGSRPALSAARLAAVGAGKSWSIETRAESGLGSAPAAPLASPPGANRPAVRMAAVPTLETAPITLPTMEPMIPERPKSKSGTILTIVGLAAVLSSVLFVWKPWQSGAPKQNSTQSTQGATLAVNQNPANPSVPVASEPGTFKPSTTAPSGPASSVPTPAGAMGTPAPGATHPEKVAKPDSATQTDETIEAAVAPGFQSESIDISSAKVDLSTSASSGSSAIAPTELSRRYAAASAQAKQEFLAKVVSSGFIRIFSTQRLATADGISGAQAAWTGGAEAVRQYRARIAKLESVYEDSVISSQRSQRWPPEEMRAWTSHASLSEPGEAVQVADLMFHQVGEMLALLQAQQGQYEVKNGTFAFKDPTVAQRYNTFRIWVAQRAEAWASTPESARPLTISQILKALGDGLPAAS